MLTIPPLLWNKLVLQFYCCCLLLISLHSYAQTDAFAGTWQMKNPTTTTMPSIEFVLQIATAANQILYPAKLSVFCDTFKATYQFLMVKKSSRELAISKNKFAINEHPFSLGNATKCLNGIFDNGRDLKGKATLSLGRIQTMINNTALPDTAMMDQKHQALALYLYHFLNDSIIQMQKVNGLPWHEDAVNLIVSPLLSPLYFGLLDTVYVNTKDGNAALAGTKKTDIVTVALNGISIIEKLSISKKAYKDEFLLDTGLNMLVLFADNFGNDLPNKTTMKLEFGKKKFNLDFTRKADSAASFIVVPLYIGHDKEKDIWFRNYHPSIGYQTNLQANEQLIGSLLSSKNQLTLAIWDDAVEDGDSISIKINGEWIVKGFPVKKNPQFIMVTLKPGVNSLSFIGDNLGSIPPNTSVLEIIDGKRRKSFMLESILGESKVLNIFYDLNGY